MSRRSIILMLFLIPIKSFALTPEKADAKSIDDLFNGGYFQTISNEFFSVPGADSEPYGTHDSVTKGSYKCLSAYRKDSVEVTEYPFPAKNLKYFVYPGTSNKNSLGYYFIALEKQFVYGYKNNKKKKMNLWCHSGKTSVIRTDEKVKNGTRIVKPKEKLNSNTVYIMGNKNFRTSAPIRFK